VHTPYIGIHYPEEFGGQGLGLFESLLVSEAFCRVDSGIGSAISFSDLGSEIILKFGIQEQKERFLIPLVRGEKRLSVAFGESEDRKNCSSILSTAEKKEKGYLIVGEKRFVPNISLADAFMMLCKEPKEGLVILIVERDRVGMEIHPIDQMGLRMIPFGHLRVKEVWVPHSNQVGTWENTIHQFDYFNQVMGLKGLAQALGTIEGAFDRALKYANQREQFSRRLSQFQVIRHKLADMAVGMEVVRCLTYKSVVEFDRKEMDQGFLSLAQLEVGRRLVWGVNEALQIFGGYGYIAEQDIEHFYRDAWALLVELGTEEELKDIFTEGILGKHS
jgi:alkylation response protein AidB-like acyl-CoA dehydrogenase